MKTQLTCLMLDHAGPLLSTHMQVINTRTVMTDAHRTRNIHD